MAPPSRSPSDAGVTLIADGPEATADFTPPGPTPNYRSDATADALISIAGGEASAIKASVESSLQASASIVIPPFFTDPDSFPSVQLGASDIDTIIKALLPPLADVLSKLTPDQQYAGLFTEVSKLALNKTFANDDELASLVQDISKQVVDLIAADFVTANPDERF